MSWTRTCAIALLLLGCQGEAGDAEVAEAPSAPTAERSPDELDPEPEERPHTEISGAFAAAAHEQGMRLRETEPETARSLFRDGCDHGFAPSCLALADLLEHAGTVDELSEARGAVEQACEAGSTEACDRLGH